MKVGRIRISFSAKAFLDFKEFEQQLNLKNGNITIKCKNKSYPESIEISLLMWVDIFSHSLHVESSSNKALEMKVAYESWRTSDKYILDDKKARFSSFSFEEYPGDVLKKKDSIIVFDHHRRINEYVEATLSYVETYASSACEMVAEILQYFTENLRLKVSEAEAMKNAC